MLARGVRSQLAVHVSSADAGGADAGNVKGRLPVVKNTILRSSRRWRSEVVPQRWLSSSVLGASSKQCYRCSQGYRERESSARPGDFCADLPLNLKSLLRLRMWHQEHICPIACRQPARSLRNPAGEEPIMRSLDAQLKADRRMHVGGAVSELSSAMRSSG